MREKFKRWRIPYIGKGANNLRIFAGHHIVLGVKYEWNQMLPDYAITRSLSFWGLFAIRHNDRRGGLKSSCKHGYSFTHASLNLKAAIIKADTYIK